MPAIVPHRFLVRLAHPCPYVKAMPKADDDFDLDLPESARLKNYAELDGLTAFADIRMAWNEFGVGVQFTVQGKSKPRELDPQKPKSSDGLTLWLDTRDARKSHRASRFCHQFHLLPGQGADEPVVIQTKINRALQDAPLADTTSVLLSVQETKGRYTMSAFLPAAVLNGYDPEQFPLLGVGYHLLDGELGNQFLNVNSDFPSSDDPSLWDVLELVRPV